MRVVPLAEGDPPLVDEQRGDHGADLCAARRRSVSLLFAEVGEDALEQVDEPTVVGHVCRDVGPVVLCVELALGLPAQPLLVSRHGILVEEPCVAEPRLSDVAVPERDLTVYTPEAALILAKPHGAPVHRGVCGVLGVIVHHAVLVEQGAAGVQHSVDGVHRYVEVPAELRVHGTDEFGLDVLPLAVLAVAHQLADSGGRGEHGVLERLVAHDRRCDDSPVRDEVDRPLRGGRGDGGARKAHQRRRPGDRVDRLVARGTSWLRGNSAVVANVCHRISDDAVVDERHRDRGVGEPVDGLDLYAGENLGDLPLDPADHERANLLVNVCLAPVKRRLRVGAVDRLNGVHDSVEDRRAVVEDLPVRGGANLVGVPVGEDTRGELVPDLFLEPVLHGAEGRPLCEPLPPGGRAGERLDERRPLVTGADEVGLDVHRVRILRHRAELVRPVAVHEDPALHLLVGEPLVRLPVAIIKRGRDEDAVLAELRVPLRVFALHADHRRALGLERRKRGSFGVRTEEPEPEEATEVVGLPGERGALDLVAKDIVDRRLGIPLVRVLAEETAHVASVRTPDGDLEKDGGRMVARVDRDVEPLGLLVVECALTRREGLARRDVLGERLREDRSAELVRPRHVGPALGHHLGRGLPRIPERELLLEVRPALCVVLAVSVEPDA